MWSCQACMRRTLQTLLGDSAALCTPSSARKPLQTGGKRSLQRRPYSVQKSTAKQRGDDTLFANAIPFVKDVSSEPTREQSREEWLKSRGTRPANKPSKLTPDEVMIRQHLTYLKDPLKLADHVRTLLRGDQFEKTLEIVRAASRNLQCIVSWNHLIDYLFSRGKMNAALKIYNEMKKRAQVPDAHTYTIIFSGCSEHPHKLEALNKGLSIYRSMQSEKCPVKPNTIHLNAVLKMCARAQDIESLFEIADGMPYHGIQAPNNLSYTTILNAIRMYAVVDLRGTQTPMQKRAEARKAVMFARKYWANIVERWRKGDMWIDEELVCSMGRVLLIGGPDDHDDILSLVQQTMNIPRQVSVSEQIDQGSPSKVSQENGELEPGSGSGVSERPSIDEFRAVVPIKEPSNSLGIYARPGQNTLSLLMTALFTQKRKAAAAKYWQILTKEFGVKPDAENYHSYLRVLRLARSSTETVELLLSMPSSFMEQKTFRIAMATCERDKLNRHVFSNAGKILDIMQNSLETPSIPSLVCYLNTAVSAKAYARSSSTSDSEAESRYAQGRQISRALDRLGPSLVNIRAALSYGDARANKESTLVVDVLNLAKKMIGAHDQLMNNALVPRDQHKYLIGQRNKLASYVSRYKAKHIPKEREATSGSALEKESSSDD